LLTACVLVGMQSVSAAADALPLVVDVEQQPLVSATGRLIEALEYVALRLKI
jgi:hypothetical protein